MPKPNDAELIARWQHQPAPLLPLLHAFHDRDGFLSEDAIRAVGKGLGQPLADLFGTVTFYHHFARVLNGQQAPRVCTGTICRLHGADALLAALQKDGATAMPCSGRCDQPVPVLKGNATWAGASAALLRPSPVSPLPPPNPAQGRQLGGFEECVFANLRQPHNDTLAGYRQHGGYDGLQKALSLSPAEVLAVITDSKLAGRGGAGFPTGQKRSEER